jgi:hypothetical protein
MTLNRRVIPATCTVHPGARGFTNLVVHKIDTPMGVIRFDPHATGECGFTLDEAAATELFDALGQWLGLEGRRR